MNRWIKHNITEEFHKSGFIIRIIAYRHKGYYLANLITPLLVVVVCGLSKILVQS